MDGKFEYIVRTLSRTKRKDYENYVINAIYNRIGDLSLKPVSQQFIKKPSGGHYFIDLYFPQLNLGIECDEGYHKANENNDKIREMTIFDILNSILDADGYVAEHVDVTLGIAEIENRINSIVDKIKKKIKTLKSEGDWVEWEEINYEEFLLNNRKIKVSDKVPFRTITDASNAIFSTKYTNQQHAWFTIPGAAPLKAWFPKLAVNGKAVSNGWNNELSADGKYILEFNEKFNYETIPGHNTENNQPDRVTFARAKDPITGVSTYRFVGIFRKDADYVGAGTRHKLVNDRFSIMKKDI